MSSIPVAHDHVVLLLDTPEFENLPSWLTENFNVIEGGTHAGGSSRNKLIVFRDGTYLELFNWIKEPAHMLWWANKPPGLIDFALTTMPPISAEQNFHDVSSRLSQIPSTSSLGVTYGGLNPGGRKRADGIEVKWNLSRPVYKTTNATPDERYFPTGRLDAAFFCHDVTERKVRVPFDDEDITTHPCGAVGIDSVQVLVPDSHFEKYLALYAAILGCDATDSANHTKDHHMRPFEISVPVPVDPRPAFVYLGSEQRCVIPDIVDTPGDLDELRKRAETHLKERGIGVYGVILRLAGGSHETAEVALGTDAIGKKVKVRKPL